MLRIHLLRQIGDECGCGNSSLIGEVQTAVFGQKENMGKGEYGKGTFRADQFCILGTLGQWLGILYSQVQ